MTSQKPGKPLTLSQQVVLDMVRGQPGITLTLIQKQSFQHRVRPKAASKAVYDLLKSKHLRRENGIGIRGGYGYFVTELDSKAYRNQWQHLLAADDD
jgi:hypothetical protein